MISRGEGIDFTEADWRMFLNLLPYDTRSEFLWTLRVLGTEGHVTPGDMQSVVSWLVEGVFGVEVVTVQNPVTSSRELRFAGHVPKHMLDNVEKELEAEKDKRWKLQQRLAGMQQQLDSLPARTARHEDLLRHYREAYDKLQDVAASARKDPDAGTKAAAILATLITTLDLMYEHPAPANAPPETWSHTTPDNIEASAGQTADGKFSARATGNGFSAERDGFESLSDAKTWAMNVVEAFPEVPA